MDFSQRAVPGQRDWKHWHFAGPSDGFPTAAWPLCSFFPHSPHHLVGAQNGLVLRSPDHIPDWLAVLQDHSSAVLSVALWRMPQLPKAPRTQTSLGRQPQCHSDSMRISRGSTEIHWIPGVHFKPQSHRALTSHGGQAAKDFSLAVEAHPKPGLRLLSSVLSLLTS